MRPWFMDPGDFGKDGGQGHNDSGIGSRSFDGQLAIFAFAVGAS